MVYIAAAHRSRNLIVARALVPCLGLEVLGGFVRLVVIFLLMAKPPLRVRFGCGSLFLYFEIGRRSLFFP